jgi:glycosyltransferase involved in cell wall biosynthesis
MAHTVAIITPAFHAQSTLATTATSVLNQTHGDWEHWIIADDGFDYRAFMYEQGLNDPRQRFLTSGGVGLGASVTRNVALDTVTAPYAAILDADDRLKPQKLEKAVSALKDFPIVTTALDVMDMEFSHLRFVGNGADRALTPGEHKWVSLSMDAMVVWDRGKADGRFDTGMSNMTDLEFLLQLYRTAPQSYHFGEPLHDYIKREGSMSNSTNVTEGMIRSKAEILRRLESGYYGLARSDVEGLAGFLKISIEAEAAFGDALAAQPGLLFEDHLEPRLNSARSTKG